MKRKIDLLNFFKTGKFFDVNFGDNKAKIIKIFGNPGEYGYWNCDDKTEIINYGRLEFYFFEDKLFQIFSDGWFKKIDFGKNIICDFWILKNLNKCKLTYFIKKLHGEKIPFKKKITDINVQIILKNGIIFYFEPYKKNIKQNKYKLVAFCLTDQ